MKCHNNWQWEILATLNTPYKTLDSTTEAFSQPELYGGNLGKGKIMVIGIIS